MSLRRFATVGLTAAAAVLLHGSSAEQDAARDYARYVDGVAVVRSVEREVATLAIEESDFVFEVPASDIESGVGAVIPVRYDPAGIDEKGDYWLRGARPDPAADVGPAALLAMGAIAAVAWPLLLQHCREPGDRRTWARAELAEWGDGPVVLRLSEIEGSAVVYVTPTDPDDAWRAVDADRVLVLGRFHPGAHLGLFVGGRPVPTDYPARGWREFLLSAVLPVRPSPTRDAPRFADVFDLAAFFVLPGCLWLDELGPEWFGSPGTWVAAAVLTAGCVVLGRPATRKTAGGVSWRWFGRKRRVVWADIERVGSQGRKAWLVLTDATRVRLPVSSGGKAAIGGAPAETLVDGIRRELEWQRHRRRPA